MHIPPNVSINSNTNLHRMKKQLIPILLLAIVACNGQKKETKSTQKTDRQIIKENVSIDQSIVPQDTLNDPNHFYYLANTKLKEVAQMILDDKIQPSDNDVTFSIMDSLLSQKTEDRKFYFSVFLKILKKADGALAEAVGLPAMNYVEKYTTEFIELSSNISDDQFDSWASFIGFEIFLSSQDDPIKDGEEFIKKLNTNCSDLSGKEKSHLESFNTAVIKSIQENNK